MVLANVSIAQTQGVPRAVFSEKGHAFGLVKQGEVVVHKFAVRNEGTSSLILDRVDFNLPGLTSRFKPTIEPGAEGAVQIELNTTHLTGDLELEAVLYMNDPVQPRVKFTMSVTVDPVIEIQPLPAAYLSIYEGEKAEQVLRVVNHEEQPLEITRVEPEGTHFKAELREVQSGKVYELIITVPPGTAPGRYFESVLLHTNHSKFSIVPVGVNLFIKRNIYANPEMVDFSGINLSALAAKPELINSLYETVMLKKRHDEFEIKSIQSDVPFLKITQSPASGRSSGFQLDIGVMHEKLVVGEISGTIRITTDDKEFPEVLIPVKASIE